MSAHAPLDVDQLTPGEAAAVYLAASGDHCRAPDIARALGVAAKTVNNQLSAARLKLGVQSTVQLVALLWRADQLGQLAALADKRLPHLLHILDDG